MSAKRRGDVQNEGKTSMFALPEWYYGTIDGIDSTRQIGTIKSDDGRSLEMTFIDVNSNVVPAVGWRVMFKIEGRKEIATERLIGRRIHSSVTATKGQYGFIDKKMYFHAQNTVGGMPHVGERVEYAIGFDAIRQKDYGFNVMLATSSKFGAPDAAVSSITPVVAVSAPAASGASAQKVPRPTQELVVRCAQSGAFLNAPKDCTVDEVKRLLEDFTQVSTWRLHLFSNDVEVFGNQIVNRNSELRYSFDPESSIPFNPSQCSGLDIKSPWVVDRTDAEKELAKLIINGNMFVMITSPPATGKTALLALFQAHAPLLFPAHSPMKMVYFSAFHERKRLATLFSEEHLQQFTTNTIFMIDDAQHWYGNGGSVSSEAVETSAGSGSSTDAFKLSPLVAVEFWNGLIKHPRMNQYRGRFWFVFSVTYTTSIGSTPVVLKDTPRIRYDLLVDDSCALDYLTRIVDSLDQLYGFSVNSDLKQLLLERELLDLIVKHCGGSLGALFKSIGLLVDRYGRSPQVELKGMIAFYLSINCTRGFLRCFTNYFLSTVTTPFNGRISRILSTCVIHGKAKVNDVVGPEFELWEKLVSCGILKRLPFSNSAEDEVPTYTFQSVLAMHFVSHLIFHRATSNPATPKELMRKVIGSFSNLALKQNTDKGFVNEYTFQQAMHKGLHEHTTSDTQIFPEYSLPSLANVSKTAARPDFIVKLENETWVIEVLVLGKGIVDHVERLEPGGKYQINLMIHDWLVVDFRLADERGVLNVKVKHPNRLNVFFPQDDYASCTLTRHGDAPEVLHLCP